MRIAVDFDGTIVEQAHAYDDLTTPLEFCRGAKEALLELHAGGHVLILWSCRSNLSIRDDFQHNPRWANDPDFDVEKWRENLALNQARFQQMLDFVAAELPGVFDYIDYGNQGKVSADLYLDDRALKLGGGYLGATWEVVGRWYGGSKKPSADDSPQVVRGKHGQDAGTVPRGSRLPARSEVRLRTQATHQSNRNDTPGRVAQARPRVRPSR